VEKSAVSPIIAAKQLLEAGAKDLSAVILSNPRRDAELLLLHVLGIDRASLIAYPERLLSDTQLAQFQRLVERRKRFEPIQYITGEREFYGLRFSVTPDVLIPRPETEHLVEAALERIPADRPFEIADVGTGSGAIAVALAVARPMAKIAALDISTAALEVAKRNATAHGVAERVRFLESDLLEAVAERAFDMIVSNPPYIGDAERETLDAEVREFEPAGALFAGPSGLEIYERLIPQAAERLREGGWLLLEIGAGQESPLRRLLPDWSGVGFVDDLQGIPRVALAQRMPGPLR
jgi:release factor glutamine methyltransferase